MNTVQCRLLNVTTNNGIKLITDYKLLYKKLTYCDQHFVYCYQLCLKQQKNTLKSKQIAFFMYPVE